MRKPPAAAAHPSRSIKPALTLIATWNVNSIRSRATHVADWLGRNQPDLLLLQELKCEAHQFPHEALADTGYHATIHGQKSYNGVAILAREPVTLRRNALPGRAEDGQSRYLEIGVRNLVIGNLYLPNGNSGGEAGYQDKLDWMAALRRHAADLLAEEQDFALIGDYNVCPTDADFAKGALSATDALVRPQTRAAFRALLWLGLTDAVRALYPNDTLYTFWDYQAGAWPRNQGLRIDHALLSPRLAERLSAAVIDRAERDREKPSDHVPVLITLAD